MKYLIAGLPRSLYELAMTIGVEKHFFCLEQVLVISGVILKFHTKKCW